MSAGMAFTLSVENMGASEFHSEFVSTLCKQWKDWQADHKYLYDQTWALPLPLRMELFSNISRIMSDVREDAVKRGVDLGRHLDDYTVNGEELTYPLWTFFKSVTASTLIEQPGAVRRFAFMPTPDVTFERMLEETYPDLVTQFQMISRINDALGDESDKLSGYLLSSLGLIDVPRDELPGRLDQLMVDRTLESFDDLMTKVTLSGVIEEPQEPGKTELLLRQYLELADRFVNVPDFIDKMTSAAKSRGLIAKWVPFVEKSVLDNVHYTDTFELKLVPDGIARPELLVAKRTLNWLAVMINNGVLRNEDLPRNVTAWRLVVTDDNLINVVATSDGIIDVEDMRYFIKSRFETLSRIQLLNLGAVLHNWEVRWTTGN